MKFIFASLVLTNVGLFMWATWYKDPPAVPGPVARAEIGRDKLQLLSTPGTKLAVRKVTPPPPAPPPAIDGATCFALGPFAAPAQVQQAINQLQSWQLSPTERIDQEPLTAAYRVYLPPFPSRSAAERQRRALTRLGFTDHALITEDGLDNAISLGLFSVEANARLRITQLAAKGIQAQLQPLPNARPLYWLDIAGDVKDGRLGAATVAELRTFDWGPEARLNPRDCGAPPRIIGGPQLP